MNVGVTTGLTVIVIGLDVAVGWVVHDALLVITTVTTSLLFNVVVVKVDAVCPDTGLLFTNHW